MDIDEREERLDVFEVCPIFLFLIQRVEKMTEKKFFFARRFDGQFF